jgi:hypothetical protein
MILNTFEEFFNIFWGELTPPQIELYIAFVVTILLVYTLFKGGRKK